MSNPTTEPVRAVALAYPLDYNGTHYDPDQVVELPEQFAKQLVSDGRARWSDGGTASAPAKEA